MLIVCICFYVDLNIHLFTCIIIIEITQITISHLTQIHTDTEVTELWEITTAEK